MGKNGIFEKLRLKIDAWIKGLVWSFKGFCMGKENETFWVESLKKKK